MKKMNLAKTLLVAAMLAFPVHGLFADDATSIRSDLEMAFIKLTSNSIDGLKKALKDKESGTKDTANTKFQIAEVQTPTRTTTTTTTTSSDGTTSSNTTTSVTTSASKLGIKVWFELKDGTLINPTKKRWDRREKFYVHIQAAVPIYVSLYQNYPDSRPTSRQIYPDSKYNDSFKAIQPGQSTRLPVMFEMDDDQRDEIMSMVVVRADWKGIQNGLTTQATASVTTNNGTAQVSAQVNSTGVGTMKCINERVSTKKDLTEKEIKETVQNLNDKQTEQITKAVNEAAQSAKFQIVGSENATSSQSNDVCFYMFGPGNVGQWQLTIKK